eukprot:2170665-Rhodomonas_salina.2
MGEWEFENGRALFAARLDGVEQLVDLEKPRTIWGWYLDGTAAVGIEELDQTVDLVARSPAQYRTSHRNSLGQYRHSRAQYRTLQSKCAHVAAQPRPVPEKRRLIGEDTTLNSVLFSLVAAYSLDQYRTSHSKSVGTIYTSTA